jgi:hypothetical protein
MMGVLIFTLDASLYRDGRFVEGKEVLANPNTEGLTVIVHAKPNKKDCLEWLDRIAYRMVYVCKSYPNIDDERVIVDDTHKGKGDYIPAINRVLRSRDRKLAWEAIRQVPFPLLLAFLKENVKDIGLWRNIAKAFQWTPEEYQQALVAYGVRPIARTQWPKKKTQDEPIPYGFRHDDLYAKEIAMLDEKVANDIRLHDIDSLPKGMKKRKQKNEGWV